MHHYREVMTFGSGHASIKNARAVIRGRLTCAIFLSAIDFQTFKFMSNYSEHTYTSSDGLNLYYRDYAGPSETAPVLLCLAGLTRNSRDFDDLAERLSGRYRVLSADLRGRGKSEYATDPMTYSPPVYVQDVESLLTAAGVKEAGFVGTSLGGLLTMMASSMIRHRVKAAILNDIGPVVDPSGLERISNYVGNTPEYGSWESAAQGFRELNQEVFPSWDDEDWMRMARRTCAQQFDGRIRTDYDAGIAIPMRESGPAPAIDLWSLFEALRGIPTLAIRGELSDILSAKTLAEMQARLPRLRQVVVPRVGHAPVLSEPEAIEAIDDFLDEFLPTS